MSSYSIPDEFDRFFHAYVADPKEDLLLKISEIGERMVQKSAPPEEMAELFGDSLIRLGRLFPESNLKETSHRIAIPLMELLIAYGLAYREQEAARKTYEESRLARSVIGNTREAIWVTDPDGRLEFANPAFTIQTGYCQGEDLSAPSLFRENDDSACWFRMTKKVLENRHYRGELTMLKKNGDTYPAHVSLSGIRNDDNEITHFVGVMEDITEPKERQAELNLELDQAKRIYDRVIGCDLPVMNGVRTDVLCMPASNVGGDTVQIKQVDARRLLIFLADIVGHGLPAAMTANSVKMLFSEIAMHTDRPTELMKQLNGALSGFLLPDDVIACFCALLNTESGELEYILAGIPKPILARKDRLEALEPTGYPLGVFPQLDYRAERIFIEPGDVLTVFTDGLTEARSPTGRLLGLNGMLSGLSPADFRRENLFSRLIQNAEKHREGEPFSDDVVILSLKRNKTGNDNTVMPYNRFRTDSCGVLGVRTGQVAYFAMTRDIVIDDLVDQIMADAGTTRTLVELDMSRLRIAVFELITNAVEHGSLEMTKFKNDSAVYDSEDYWRIFKERMQSSVHGLRNLTVECRYGERELQVAVEDEGPGFYPEAIPDPTGSYRLENPSGRGLYLVKICTDELHFAKDGRRISIVLQLGKSSEIEQPPKEWVV